MELVKLPQDRNFVAEIVVDPVTQLVGQEKRDRNDGSGEKLRQLRRLHGAERGHQLGNNQIAQDLVRKHCPSNDQAEYKYAEEKIADIGRTRGTRRDAFWKQRPRDRLDTNRPVSLAAPDHQKQDGEA